MRVLGGLVALAVLAAHELAVTRPAGVNVDARGVAVGVGHRAGLQHAESCTAVVASPAGVGRA